MISRKIKYWSGYNQDLIRYRGYLLFGPMVHNLKISVILQYQEF